MYVHDRSFWLQLKFQHEPLFQAIETVLVSPKDEIKKWKKTKNAIVVAVEQSTTHDHLRKVRQASKDPIDLARAQVQFYETCPTLADQSSMINFLNPSVGICCNQAVGEGKLNLVAYGQLAKLDPKSTYIQGWRLQPLATQELQ